MPKILEKQPGRGRGTRLLQQQPPHTRGTLCPDQRTGPSVGQWKGGCHWAPCWSLPQGRDFLLSFSSSVFEVTVVECACGLVFNVSLQIKCGGFNLGAVSLTWGGGV